MPRLCARAAPIQPWPLESKSSRPAGHGIGRIASVNASVAIVLSALMAWFAAPATAAANEVPTIVVAPGFDFPEIAGCHPDGNSASIPLMVADLDGTPDELTLTGTSSAQTVVPDAAITFAGVGAVRSVAIGTVPSNSGRADVTITVSDGSASNTVVIRVFAGGPGPDSPVFGSLDSDLMLGRGGNDHLIAGIDDTKPPPVSTGRDFLCGGQGNDHLEGQDEEDTVDGQTGDDLVKGAQGNDIVRGSSGDDRISGRGGSDLYSCGPGTDTIYGYRRHPENGALPDTNDGTCEQIPPVASAVSE